MLGGVCAGLGRYLGVDPVLLRVAFVLLVLAGGSGVLLYVVGWIFIPEEKEGEELGTAPASGSDSLRLVAGGALIALGVIWLLDLTIPNVGKYVLPLSLVVIGVAVIVQVSRR